MRPEFTRYVFCYDVTDQKRRTRLAKCIDSYGDRVQFSVLEAVLDASLAASLLEEIQKIINLQLDRVSIFPLCAGCAKRALRLGKAVDVPGQEVVFVA